jgi:predicted secreted protein
MQLGGVSFTVSPEARRQAENELINHAVAAFQARADLAAKAIGGRTYKIRRISLNTGGFPPVPRPMGAPRAMTAQAAEVAPPVFEAGTSVVNVVASGTVEVE